MFFARRGPLRKEGDGARFLGRIQTHFALARQAVGGHCTVYEESARLCGAAVAAGERCVQRNARCAKLFPRGFHFRAAFFRELALCPAAVQAKAAIGPVGPLQLNLVVLGAAMAHVDDVATARQQRCYRLGAFDQRLGVAAGWRRAITGL